MARLNEDAQWIILMGFLVSFSFFFLALVINQSTVVGQSTSESVIEFPKNDIRDVRGVVIQSSGASNGDIIRNDISIISLTRKNAVVNYSTFHDINHTFVDMHYNNGVTEYNENWTSL
jgi:hypothetical protein